jgi:soluble lytic murein transglycosylase-like protein
VIEGWLYPLNNRRLLKRFYLAVLGVTLSASILFLLPVSAQAFCFEEAGAQYSISSQLLQSIAHVESGLNPKAVNINKNGSADFGLMQINAAWLNVLHLNREELLSDPCYNVMTGARILRACIDRYGYTWEAVGCYNATGLSKRVDYSWKIYQELKKRAANNTKMVGKNESLPETDRSDRSFHFKVRSVNESEINGEP